MCDILWFKNVEFKATLSQGACDMAAESSQWSMLPAGSLAQLEIRQAVSPKGSV